MALYTVLTLQGCLGATAGTCEDALGRAGGGALLRLPVSWHAPLQPPCQLDTLEGKLPHPLVLPYRNAEFACRAFIGAGCEMRCHGVMLSTCLPLPHA